MYNSKPTAEQRAAKRYAEKIKTLAWTMRDALQALPHDAVAQVPPLFATIAKTTEDRYETFRVLDEQPGRFDSYTSSSHWHSLLRRTRNHPDHGRDLFDAINNRGAFEGAWMRAALGVRDARNTSHLDRK